MDNAVLLQRQVSLPDGHPPTRLWARLAVFLLDWCCLQTYCSYLWTASGDPNFFTLVFCIAHGALPWQFTSSETPSYFLARRITSCFIHISPMLVMWSLRWFGPCLSKITDGKSATLSAQIGADTMGQSNQHVRSISRGNVFARLWSVFWTLAMPVAAYIVWFVVYGVVICVLSPDLNRFSTTTRI